MGILKITSVLLLVATLTACGSSGGGSSNSGGTPVTLDSPTSIINADSNGLITISGKATPNSTITVVYPDGSTQETTC